MKGLLTMWKREVNGFFLSPVAYIVTCFFLVIMGFALWWTVGLLSKGALTGITQATMLNDLFSGFFFWLGNLIVVPLITMRSFSEEKKSGTLEALMTTPVNDRAVVMAKFLGCLTFYAILWLPTVGYGFVLHHLGIDLQQFDWRMVAVAYLGVLLVGALFISFGLASSASTSNQLVAAMISFSMIFALLLIGLLPYAAKATWVQETTTYFSTSFHMLDFSRGVIDSRALVYYLSGIALFLYLALKITESRRWK